MLAQYEICLLATAFDRCRANGVYKNTIRAFSNRVIYSRCSRQSSDGKLTFRKEWKHPSVAGKYLAVCVLYAMRENKSPEGLVNQAFLDDKMALILRQFAWQVVQVLKRK